MTPNSKNSAQMSDEVEFEMSVDDCTKIAEIYPDSYFTAAVEFAKTQEKTDVDIGLDGAIFAVMANPTELVETMNKLIIKTDDFNRVMFTALLEANQDNESIYFSLVPEMVRLKMYKEMYDYVPYEKALLKDVKVKDIFTEAVCKEILKVANFHKSIVDFFNTNFNLNLFHSLIGYKYHLLLWACTNSLPNIASQLVDTCSLDELNNIDSCQNTLLMWACNNKLPQLALKIIEKGFTEFDQVNSTSNTALIFACKNNLSKVALAILAAKPSNIAQINNVGDTAFTLAIANYMQDVAFVILATGKANIGHTTHTGDTALIIACWKKLPELALAILATGEAKPSHHSKNGTTALAQVVDMPEVKIAIELALAGADAATN